MAVSGVVVGEEFTTNTKRFKLAAEVGGEQVIIDGSDASAGITVLPPLYIARPNNNPFTPIAPYNEDQLIIVTYPSGMRQEYVVENNTPVLKNEYYMDDGTTATVWVILAATASTWADPDNPTQQELTDAYEAVAPVTSRTVGDVVAVENTELNYVRFDAEDGTVVWQFSDNFKDSLDVRPYILTRGTPDRDQAPTPGQVGSTAWGVGSRITVHLSTGITEVWQADSETTAAFVRVIYPLQPFDQVQLLDGWKAGETYRTLRAVTDAPNQERKFQWISYATTLVSQEFVSEAIARSVSVNVIKAAGSVVPGDLIDGALFDSNLNLLDPGDAAVATYRYTILAGRGALEVSPNARVGAAASSAARNFLLTRTNPLDASTPTVGQLQTAGYTVTQFRPFDTVITTLGSSRRMTSVVNESGLSFLPAILDRIDNQTVDATTGDGTASSVLPNVAGYRDGDLVTVIKATDPMENGLYTVIDDGTREWERVITAPMDASDLINAGNGLNLAGSTLSVDADAVTGGGDNILTVGVNGVYVAPVTPEATTFVDDVPTSGEGAIGDQAVINEGQDIARMVFRRLAPDWEYVGQFGIPTVTAMKSAPDQARIGTVLTDYGGTVYRFRLLVDDGDDPAGVYEIDADGVLYGPFVD